MEREVTAQFVVAIPFRLPLGPPAQPIGPAWGIFSPFDSPGWSCMGNIPAHDSPGWSCVGNNVTSFYGSSCANNGK
eukprot:6059448-Pyramimonas_sp.AAC.1